MSEVKNKYRYVLTDKFGTLEVAPLGEGDEREMSTDELREIAALAKGELERREEEAE